MKDLWIALMIIAFVFIGNTILKNYYESSGEEILVEVDKLKEGIQTDSEEVKQENISKIREKWDDTQKHWIMFQYHEHVNTMEDVLLECLDSYKEVDEGEFQRAHDKLKRAIEDLKNREEISILNIL